MAVETFKSVCCPTLRGFRLIGCILTVKKLKTAGTNTMCPSYGGVRYERIDYNPQANPKVVDSIPTEVQSFFSQLACYLIPFNLHHIFVCYFHSLAKTVPSFLSVEEKCLFISAPSVNISLAWTRIRIIVKNVTFAGRCRDSCRTFSTLVTYI